MKKGMKFVTVLSLIFAMFCVSLMSSVSKAYADMLEPTSIPKYTSPLIIPPAMPKTGIIGSSVDYYEIAVRQFNQQILPPGFPFTTVWSYGSTNHPGSFNYPAFTIEAKVYRPVRVKWINDLKDPLTGNFLPHLLPVDQTIHWANPAQDCMDGLARTDCMGWNPLPYAGPVPIVTHVHGAHVGQESDGYPEAWFLPDANNIPEGYATEGSHFAQIPGVPLNRGAAVFQYPNDQRPTTLWYHDHSIGMTRLNVYAGPAGFYLLRGGLFDIVSLALPKPAPQLGDAPGKKYYEIPIAIQDRSFKTDGALFYPDNRAFFEGLSPDQLQIPFIPDMAFNEMSDVSPIWNPEFFGNTMVVNGRTWPYLDVEQRRYRFRLLNGNDTRFLILRLVTGDPTTRPGASALSFWQIGADGGFLPKPAKLETLLMSPAERADVVVDFTKIPVGTDVYLINEGPDSPFGGGIPGVDFPYADVSTTGQIMKFRVGKRTGIDFSIPPQYLPLPKPEELGIVSNVRKVSLNEAESGTVFAVYNSDGTIVYDPTNLDALPFAPIRAMLGTVNVDGSGIPQFWGDGITENPSLNSTEIWEIHNFTEDAHPIHLHLVQFEVLDRTPMGSAIGGPATKLSQVWEKGRKDTVTAYPGEVTRIKARFDKPGLFVWHCHILEHEDNEMMRPYFVGTMP